MNFSCALIDDFDGGCVTTQLEDGHSLFDYDVGLNDIIQLMVRPVVTSRDATTYSSTASAQNGTGEGERGEKMDTVSDV